MPYTITKNKNGSFRVVSSINPYRVYAYSTRNFKKLISAIELNKKREYNQQVYHKRRLENFIKNYK
jgi:hypothetical protein